MKLLYACLFLLLFIVFSSMTQCNKCVTGHLIISQEAKRWLPYGGQDSVSFIAGSQIKKFRIFFVDTTERFRNVSCPEEFYADRMSLDLEINPADSLFINCVMGSPAWMCFRSLERSTFYLSACNVLYGPETEMRRHFSSLTLNNVNYTDVALVNAYPGTNPAFDSVYFAKDRGIIAFSYNHIKHFLQ